MLVEDGLVPEEIGLEQLVDRVVDVVIGLARLHDPRVDTVGVELAGGERVGETRLEELAAREARHDRADAPRAGEAHAERVDGLEAAVADVRVPPQAVGEDRVHVGRLRHVELDPEVGAGGARVLERRLGDVAVVQREDERAHAELAHEPVQHVGAVLAAARQDDAVLRSSCPDLPDLAEDLPEILRRPEVAGHLRPVARVGAAVGALARVVEPGAGVARGEAAGAAVGDGPPRRRPRPPRRRPRRSRRPGGRAAPPRSRRSRSSPRGSSPGGRGGPRNSRRPSAPQRARSPVRYMRAPGRVGSSPKRCGRQVRLASSSRGRRRPR